MCTKKAFSLMELLAVISIVGVLAGTAITQYGRTIEKSRGAEARQVLGVIRSLALAHWNEYSSLTVAPAFSNAEANIGTAVGQIPSAPRNSHYFTYAVNAPAANSVTMSATRCSNNASCKGGIMSLGAGVAITLQVTCPDGTDVWNIPAPWR